MFLKKQPGKYTLVDDQRTNYTKPSTCWNQFALPAVKDENNRHIIIKNFATCRSSYKTNTYTHGSTKSLNLHVLNSHLQSPTRQCDSTSLFSRLTLLVLLEVNHRICP